METRAMLRQSRRDNAAYALRQARFYRNYQYDSGWAKRRIIWHMMRYAEWKALAMEVSEEERQTEKGETE